MIVLIHGPDSWSARAHLRRVLAEHDPTGANTTQVDGRTATIPQLIAQVGSAGFFAERRVIVVHNLVSRAYRSTKSSGPEETGESEDGGGTLDLAPLLDASRSGNVLVLFDADLAGVPASLKRLLPVDACVTAGEAPRGQQLVAWLMKAAQEEGGQLDAATARLLLNHLYPNSWSTKPANPRFDRPPDLERLHAEVAKLVTAAYPGPITSRHVDALVPKGDADQLFRFTDAVAGSDLPRALEELAKLIDAGEEPFRLTAQLHQQVELAVVLDTAGAPRDPIVIGKALGLSNPNRMVGVAASVRTQPPGTAMQAVQDATRLDAQAKRGELRTPEDVLYAIVLDRARRATPHEKSGLGGT